MPAVVYHPQYQAYDFGPGHPFSPTRQALLVALLRALGHWSGSVRPAPATRAAVRAVHSEALVEQVEAASAGALRPGAARFGIGTGDNPVFEGMDAAARLLAGGTLRAAQHVASGEAQVALQLGGGLHHAHADRASGFCIYNDLAVAIRHLTGEGLRVAYVDVDVHHGDGVQSIFYDTHEVLTISLHESGRYLFPGTGGVDELGSGAGRGLKLNVPLEPGTSDASYLDAFEHVVPHALSWFQPDVLVVQCGADAHASDPLAHLQLTTRAYEMLFRRLRALAEEYAGGRVVFTLGGGYNLDATVRVWALLYLVLHDLPLPARLPEAWRARWAARLKRSLSPTLHDASAPAEHPHREAIEAQNRKTCRHLMARAAKCWR